MLFLKIQHKYSENSIISTIPRKYLKICGQPEALKRPADLTTRDESTP
jgi:hypothetical protein